MVVEEFEVEKVGEEGVRLGEGKKAKVSVAEDGRRLWRRVAVDVIGGGWSEARGEGGAIFLKGGGSSYPLVFFIFLFLIF
jgi:hypothetical protein